MGTRSLTYVENTEGENLCCLYEQYDGYPTGVGQKILDHLKGCRLVNGLSSDPKALNGMMDVAALHVSIRKGKESGNVYLFPPNSTDHGEEYRYHIKPLSNQIWLKVESVQWEDPIHVIYDGYLNEFDPKAAEILEGEL